MATEITNSDYIIDSRDIIERIEELAETDYDTVMTYLSETGENPTAAEPEDQDELDALVKFADEIDGHSSEFRHGMALIREDYFETYAEDLAHDLGFMPRDMELEWPFTHIDWAAAANELKQDYTEFDFDGATYYGMG